MSLFLDREKSFKPPLQIANPDACFSSQFSVQVKFLPDNLAVTRARWIMEPRQQEPRQEGRRSGRHRTARNLRTCWPADTSPNIDACPENLVILLHIRAIGNTLLTPTNLKKVLVSPGIIETPGRWTARQWASCRSHSSFVPTFQVLRKVHALKVVSEQPPDCV